MCTFPILSITLNEEFVFCKIIPVGIGKPGHGKAEDHYFEGNSAVHFKASDDIYQVSETFDPIAFKTNAVRLGV